METLLVHKEIADAFMPAMVKAYQKAHVTMIGDDRALAYEKGMIPATDEDWATEYNDLRLTHSVSLIPWKKRLPIFAAMERGTLKPL